MSVKVSQIQSSAWEKPLNWTLAYINELKGAKNLAKLVGYSISVREEFRSVSETAKAVKNLSAVLKNGCSMGQIPNAVNGFYQAADKAVRKRSWESFQTLARAGLSLPSNIHDSFKLLKDAGVIHLPAATNQLLDKISGVSLMITSACNLFLDRSLKVGFDNMMNIGNKAKEREWTWESFMEGFTRDILPSAIDVAFLALGFFATAQAFGYHRVAGIRINGTRILAASISGYALSVLKDVLSGRLIAISTADKNKPTSTVSTILFVK